MRDECIPVSLLHLIKKLIFQFDQNQQIVDNPPLIVQLKIVILILKLLLIVDVNIRMLIDFEVNIILQFETEKIFSKIMLETTKT